MLNHLRGSSAFDAQATVLLNVPAWLFFRLSSAASARARLPNGDHCGEWRAAPSQRPQCCPGNPGSCPLSCCSPCRFRLQPFFLVNHRMPFNHPCRHVGFCGCSVLCSICLWRNCVNSALCSQSRAASRQSSTSNWCCRCEAGCLTFVWTL